MRFVIEAFGHKVIDLELLVPMTRPSPHPAAGPAAPSYDPRSTTGSQIEQANDGVNGFRFGFGPIVIAEVPDGRQAAG